MIVLLIGVLIAAFVFAATLFSAAQAYLQIGALRWLHLANALSLIAAMASISLVWPGIAALLGLILVALNIALGLWEVAWNRLLAVPPILFGLALVQGVPFSAGL